MIDYYIDFNGLQFDDTWGCVVRRPAIPAPEPVYEPYIIPGMDGILMPSEVTYAPMEIDVDMNFMVDAPDGWAGLFLYLKNYLTGPGILRFSDDEGYFRKVYRANIIDVARPTKNLGTFTAHFVCDPYRYQDATEYDWGDDDEGVYSNGTEASLLPTIIVKNSASSYIHLEYEKYGRRTIRTGITVPGPCTIDTETCLVTDGDGQIINSQVSGPIENLRIPEFCAFDLLISSEDTDGMSVNLNWRTF